MGVMLTLYETGETPPADVAEESSSAHPLDMGIVGSAGGKRGIFYMPPQQRWTDAKIANLEAPTRRCSWRV